MTTWSKLVPRTNKNTPENEQLARNISQKFITHNRIRYRVIDSHWEMKLDRLDRTFLEMFVPEELTIIDVTE